MKKSDVIVADIIIYAMRQIQMAKVDRKVTGDYEYWSGEIQSMKYLLLYIDRLLGKKKNNERELPDLIGLLDRVDTKRKESFEFFMERIWEEDIED
jgi:hypothetical protein